MDYEWIGMDRLPPSGASMPIGRDDYILDMRLTGEDLSKQVAVDVPRATVTMEGVRFRDGAILEHFLRYVVLDDDVADAALAMCTQAAMAAPMRALSTTLLEKELYLSESGEPLVVAVKAERSKAVVTVEKCLNISCGQTLKTVKNVTISVAYDSSQPFVVVSLRRNGI